ncbi:MAG: hypothetical protein ABFR89_03595 [Actinomycetota bacterium]
MTDGEETGPEQATERERWPVGFLLVLGITVLYLAWRLIQGVGWLVDRVAG